MLSAPARFIAYMEVIFHSSSLIQLFAAADFIIAYSPETFCAATGNLNFSLIMDITSRYIIAGLTITISAPSRISFSISRTDSLRFVYGTWYEDLSKDL